jgi:hypothetical protein
MLMVVMVIVFALGNTRPRVLLEGKNYETSEQRLCVK